MNQAMAKIKFNESDPKTNIFQIDDSSIQVIISPLSPGIKPVSIDNNSVISRNNEHLVDNFVKA